MIVLLTICAKLVLETWPSPYNDIRNCLLGMRLYWTKARFETWITRNDVNGLNLFHLSYLITLMAYLCSQMEPKNQIKYSMFDWLIYGLFVLNRKWKRVSPQMMIFEMVCSTWSLVEIKTCLETWIRRKDENGVSSFDISFLIIHMTYLCS
jgi:hypothetical protein